jgi:hypothetical protein
MNLEKIKDFFLGIKIVVMILLYPIVSVKCYRKCKKENDEDKKKFVFYGILGIIGIIGYVVMIFVPLQQKPIIFIIALIPYGIGITKQMKLILKKQGEDDEEEEAKTMAYVIPTVKTWCLPSGLDEEKLMEIYKGISKIIVEFPEIGIKDEKLILCLFPKDLMTYGLGEEIKVEITDLIDCEKEVLDRLASEVGEFMKKIFPQAKVFIKVECYDPSDGYWASIK